LRNPLLIVGKSASGKTSLSKRLVETGRIYVSASGLLSTELGLAGPGPSRRSLADLGERLRLEGRLGRFHDSLVKAVDVTKETVVDGIRFLDSAKLLLASGTNPALIFLDCPDAVRRQRLERSGRGDDWGWLVNHPTELSVDAMREEAHLVLDGTLDPTYLLRSMLDFLARGQHGPGLP
jgi:hypothetical protein